MADCTQHVQASYDALAKAKATAQQRRDHFDGASDCVDEAEAIVRKAMSRVLLDETCPAAAKELEAAQAGLEAAKRDQDEAERWALAARDNVAMAEAEYQRALRQEASAKITAEAAEFLKVAGRIDQLYTELGTLLKRGDQLNRSISADASGKLGVPNVAKWFSVVTNDLINAARSVRDGNGRFISSLVQAEAFVLPILDRTDLPPKADA